MSLTVNGTLIPEDQANALTVNGADITAVWANGVQVWAQQLFAAQWSGNSIASGFGIQVSGPMFRAYSAANSDGVWVTVNLDGTFPPNSVSQTGDYLWLRIGVNALGQIYTRVESDGLISFSIDIGFTGNTNSANGHYLTTSGGLIRYNNSTNSTVGAWVSLT